MKKKIVLWITIIFVVLGIGTGIGVKIYMDKTEQRKQELIKEVKREEKLIADDVSNKYEGIEKITFTGYSGSDTTGEVFYAFKINDKKDEFIYSYSNDSNFWEGGPEDTVVAYFYKEKSKKIKSKIKIGYSYKEYE